MTEVIEKTGNKKGYKKTKLGWIPEDWEVVHLDSICDVRDGTHDSPKYYNYGIPFLTSKNLTENGLDFNNVNYISEEDHKRFSERSKVEIGDILFGMIGTIGNPTIVNTTKIFSIKNMALIKFFKNTKINNLYLLNTIKSRIVSNQFSRTSNESVQSFISLGKIRKLLILLPSKEEQEKIAEILSAWDDGIETLEKLIEQKEVSKKAIMQKLFLEKESWKMIRFDKIFKDFCKKNCPEERLLSATQENGVIPRDMLSGKVMSPEGSLEGYKLIESGDFVISLRSFQGGLEYSKYRGILSPAYTVLKNIINIDKDFYRHFFKSYKFIEKYLSISVIGIRDGKQISYSDLSSVKIPYPPLEEQEKIGKILNCCDEEIQILNSKLEKLKEQKKGLMQKLLTGQIRVKI